MSCEERPYRVVRNDEAQYSIWPASRDVPFGWHVEGFAGTRVDCLQHIDTVWTDMRPQSLRERMSRAGLEGGPAR